MVRGVLFSSLAQVQNKNEGLQILHTAVLSYGVEPFPRDKSMSQSHLHIVTFVAYGFRDHLQEISSETSH